MRDKRNYNTRNRSLSNIGRASETALFSAVLNDLECSLSNVCLYIVKILHKQERKNIFKMNKDAAAKKELYNTSGVGEINNYCEDIYIPPYNNTH